MIVVTLIMPIRIITLRGTTLRSNDYSYDSRSDNCDNDCNNDNDNEYNDNNKNNGDDDSSKNEDNNNNNNDNDNNNTYDNGYSHYHHDDHTANTNNTLMQNGMTIDVTMCQEMVHVDNEVSMHLSSIIYSAESCNGISSLY